MAEAERTTKILEQAMLALRNLDLTGREGPLLADSTLLSGCIGSVSAGREWQKTAVDSTGTDLIQTSFYLPGREEKKWQNCQSLT